MLYLTDRLSTRGGADHHLLDVITWAAASGYAVTVAAGRHEAAAALPPDVRAAVRTHLPSDVRPDVATPVRVVRLAGLASPLVRSDGLDELPALLAEAEVVHVQNVMNPVALEQAAATGRALVTVQDHRVFCPGPGRTLPDRSPCDRPMGHGTCAECLPDRSYRRRLLALTAARRDALAGMRRVVLSRYMADELQAAGLPGAVVLPPWIVPGAARSDPGDGVVLGGRLVRHKAPAEGWLAWRQSACGLPLRIPGAGPAAAGLEGAERLGWLSRPLVRAELRRARALLFPTFWQEPFGILGVEALAEGTPVVAAGDGGTVDWSDRGCLRVPVGDVGAMAQALAHLARDPELALALGEQGRLAVAERFAPQPLQARLAALYHDEAAARS